MNLYIVYWKDKSGNTGHGSPMKKAVAKVWMEYGNEKYEDIIHWIEKHEEEE